MQPATYQSVSTDETLQTEPYSRVPGPVPMKTQVSDPNRRSFLSMDGFLVSCIISPLMGFCFVALGFYIIYGNTILVISHSTKHAALISQSFTAAFAIWHFLALIPVVSMVKRVRSEEWWRRLLRTTTFNRANSVSSNIGGTFAHTVNICVAWSSHYFKSSWIVAIIAVVLADISPGAIHVKFRLDAIPASFLVPALLPNSIYSDYSKPFLHSDNYIYASADIAPIYLNAKVFADIDVKASPPTFNVLVPRPNVSPGQGYRYLTDVYVYFSCDGQNQSLNTQL